MMDNVQKLKLYGAHYAREMKSAWGRAVEVVACKCDGYPASFREVFNPLAFITCAMLRNAAADMVHDHPNVPEKWVKNLMKTRTKSFGLNGRSPFQACLEDPSVETMDAGKMFVRRETRRAAGVQI